MAKLAIAAVLVGLVLNVSGQELNDGCAPQTVDTSSPQCVGNKAAFMAMEMMASAAASSGPPVEPPCFVAALMPAIPELGRMCANDCTCATLMLSIQTTAAALCAAQGSVWPAPACLTSAMLTQIYGLYGSSFQNCSGFTDSHCSPLCAAAASTLVPYVRMAAASGQPGIMLYALVIAMQAGSKPDPSIIEMVTRVLAAPGSPDTAWVDTAILGEYDYCTSQHEAAYCTMAVHADGAPSKISWGWCVPKACDADGLHAFFSNMSALPPGHFDASCTSDARPALGDSGGAVFILFLLTAFVVLGIIATALDTWPGLVALFSGGPNAVAVDNAGHTAVEMSPPGLGDDGDDDELLLHVDGDDAGVREDAPAVANAKDRAKPMSFWRKLLACFSMTRNMPKLVSMAPQKGAIPSLNGIRVLSMCWVVLGHVFLMGLQVMPAKFPIQVAQGIGDPTYQMISNAFFSVDTFFFLSGFLVTYGMLKKLDALGVDSAGSFFSKFPLLQMYLHRWLRLTPLYMIVLGFFTWLMPYLYEGPFFVGAIKDSVDSCKEHWWANLLYINNFYPIDFSDGQCMGWTWYMANDMQFFVVAPLWIVPLHLASQTKNPLMSKGVLWWAVSTLTFLAVTFKISIDDHMVATVVALHRKSDSDGQGPGMGMASQYYEKPYCRISVYLVGVLFGWLVRKDMLPRRIPAWAYGLGYTAIFVLGYVTIWGLQTEVQYDMSNSQSSWADPNATTDAWYNSLARPVWALLLCILVYFCHYGYGGWINGFLSSPIWIPLGRMSYAVYLIHLWQLIGYFGSLHDPRQFNFNQLWHEFLSNLVVVFFFAFWACLLIEFPLGAVIKLLFMGGGGSGDQNKPRSING